MRRILGKTDARIDDDPSFVDSVAQRARNRVAKLFADVAGDVVILSLGSDVTYDDGRVVLGDTRRHIRV